MRIGNVVIQPVISEKSMVGEEKNRYTFAVDRGATKNAVKNEIEKIYNVNVLNVWTSVIPGKKRRILRTRRFTKTPGWKKAVVELKEGQKIELVEK